MTSYIVTVQLHRDPPDAGHYYAFSDPQEALAYFRRYLEMAASGRWFERLDMRVEEVAWPSIDENTSLVVPTKQASPQQGLRIKV